MIKILKKLSKVSNKGVTKISFENWFIVYTVRVLKFTVEILRTVNYSLELLLRF